MNQGIKKKCGQSLYNLLWVDVIIICDDEKISDPLIVDL